MTDIAKAAGLAERTVQTTEIASGVTAETAERIRRVWVVLRHRPGPAPRSYPWLADLIAQYPIMQVADGAGVKVESVRRLTAGRPVSRPIARRVCAWAVLQRMTNKQLATARSAA